MEKGSPHPKMVNNMFGPNTKGHYYMPVKYHNATTENPSNKGRKSKALKDNKVKTTWVIHLWEQYNVFCIADENEWYAEKNKVNTESSNNNIDENTKEDGLCSILEGGKTMLGENGEMLAFFPTPQNENDAWHGYPVFSKYISDSIFNIWFKNKVIDMIMWKRLLKGVI